ncbi:glycosyltransferase [Roseomonas sp. KE2513]|uniref:glycosyltransferase n=1 Tax=Roseomonas sp. KE2513 TaxID=2479202 RepID=UPI0018DF3253|nr:glycosyltransferase [Roseomonas sp. KE2513]MBI0535691.1 glycosyltransferase [Roseomonas sp. KE2513]
MTRPQKIAFVTDELFLPPRNGSQQIYTSVAQRYADQGAEIYSVCFFRDRALADAEETQAAYRKMFKGHMFLPGWNNGGKLSGKLGQAWRELERRLTGDVFASHPLLATLQSGPGATLPARQLLNWDIDIIYFHKIHALQLAGRIIRYTPGIQIVLDLHDDFVKRASEYQEAYGNLFRKLSLASAVKQHGAAWLRHHFTRVSLERSRQTELKLLSRCNKILVASPEEFEFYSSFPELAGKVIYAPWPQEAQAPSCRRRDKPPEFHAGFVASDDVMNLDAMLFFSSQVLPLIRQAIPEFKFLIAGRIAGKVQPVIRNARGVTVWPHLDVVNDFYENIQVAVVPLRYGTGVSVKVLEALAFGKPIVSTTVGVRGLTSAQIARATVTNDPQEFATSVVEYLAPGKTVPLSAHSCHGDV